jgi:LysR family glycine cleavage system transcriptional activator
MKRIPSLHALRAFEAAARLGSFTRAGGELHLTPSAISHQIRSLENQFKKPLFLRANRQVILTPEGERLLVALSEAFGTIRQACTELMPHDGKDTLAVHCTPSFAAKWLSPRLPDFMRREPKIKIRMSSSAEAPDLLQHPGIDVVLTYGTPPRMPGVTAQSLGPEEVVALCTPAYETAYGAPEIFAMDDVVWLESSLSPVKWPDWFSLNGIVPPPSEAGPSFDRGSMAIAAAVQGVGVALETTRFAETEIEAGSLVPFGGDRFKAIRKELHFLCYRTVDRDSPKTRKFCEWLIAEAILRKL